MTLQLRMAARRRLTNPTLRPIVVSFAGTKPAKAQLGLSSGRIVERAAGETEERFIQRVIALLPATGFPPTVVLFPEEDWPGNANAN